MRRGATLIEVLITMAVFSLLMLAMIAVMKIGTMGYRDVTSRSDVTSSLHKFEADISAELERASLASLTVYTPASDYRWAIWFQTPMNDPALVNSSGVPQDLGNPISLISDGNGQPVGQRWVLYYITRIDQTEHQNQFGTPCSSYGTAGGPDTTCVHKWIVKKDIRLYPSPMPSPAPTALVLNSTTVQPFMSDLGDNRLPDSSGPTEAGLAAEVNSATYNSGLVERTSVVMHNVVSFELTRLALTGGTDSASVEADNGPIVLFDVKAFKLLDAQGAVGFGSAPVVTVPTPTGTSTDLPVVNQAPLAGPQQSTIGSSVVSQYVPYTVQVDSRIVPGNP